MTYWATLRHGGQMLLGEPKEAVLSYDRGAPADQLKAVFPADRIWEELAEVCSMTRARAFSGGWWTSRTPG